MTEELELSNYTAVYEFEGAKVTKTTDAGPEKERRLLRIGILILGISCILQATLNVSLRLALNPKDDGEQFPFNSSTITALCPSEQQNSTQFGFCCSKVLRQLLSDCHVKIIEKKKKENKGDVTRTDEEFSGSGSTDLSFI